MQDEIRATIQLDKLTLCCISTKLVPDIFNHLCVKKIDFAEDHVHFQSFGKTTLIEAIDYSGRFQHCYNVSHDNYHIGKIKFGLNGKPALDCNVWFSISNRVFYNNTLQFLPDILRNLSLRLSNVTRIEIALDNYTLNYNHHLRKNLRNKENKVKLLGRYIDRKTLESRIRYWNYGSLDNPFKVRTIYIKNKRKVNYSKNKKQHAEEEGNPTNDSKTTMEFAAYDKLEEIDDFSPHKTYILDYHKDHNPKYKNIYREEIRLEYEELRRFEKKRDKPIALTELLNKEFLYEVFTEYMDRIIVIRDSKNQKIDLFPKPFLGDCKGKLPLTLPQPQQAHHFAEYNDIPIIENQYKDFNNMEYLTAKFFNNQDYIN